MNKILIGQGRLPIYRSQQDVRLSDKRGILPFTRSSLRENTDDTFFQLKQYGKRKAHQKIDNSTD